MSAISGLKALPRSFDTHAVQEILHQAVSDIVAELSSAIFRFTSEEIVNKYASDSVTQKFSNIDTTTQMVIEKLFPAAIEYIKRFSSNYLAPRLETINRETDNQYAKTLLLTAFVLPEAEAVIEILKEEPARRTRMSTVLERRFSIASS